MLALCISMFPESAWWLCVHSIGVGGTTDAVWCVNRHVIDFRIGMMLKQQAGLQLAGWKLMSGATAQLV